MLNLHTLQTQFLQAVKGDGQVDDLPIFETNGIAKETRMGIYRYAYWTRIESSLSEDFPRTDLLLVNWAFTFEDLVHDFMMTEKNNFASLGELSKAFYLYVLSISDDKKLVTTLRTDFSCLMSELSPWNILYHDYARSVLAPDQVVQLESHQINTLWNLSLYTFDTTLIFQKSGSTQITDLKSESPQIFELLEMRKSIQTFDQLIEAMSHLQFDESATSKTIQFLCENEILFFTRAGEQEKCHHSDF